MYRFKMKNKNLIIKKGDVFICNFTGIRSTFTVIKIEDRYDGELDALNLNDKDIELDYITITVWHIGCSPLALTPGEFIKHIDVEQTIEVKKKYQNKQGYFRFREIFAKFSEDLFAGLT
jgi:hypothetical protein